MPHCDYGVSGYRPPQLQQRFAIRQVEQLHERKVIHLASTLRNETCRSLYRFAFVEGKTDRFHGSDGQREYPLLILPGQRQNDSCAVYGLASLPRQMVVNCCCKQVEAYESLGLSPCKKALEKGGIAAHRGRLIYEKFPHLGRSHRFRGHGGSA